ncbi:MAG: ABC transporter substrate-binding protein [Bifidobacterium thermacidophilum]|jgi:peptide/nickel transport system substrate-binding protein|uniref:ABC transporter substrate-binding protein n=1 Tax=Bifidobacterium thermacidophilum TaxID=246618 RepID=UPI002F353629
MNRKNIISMIAVIAVSAIACSGCGSGSTASSSGGSTSGGTIKLVGTDDIDHLDPTGSSLVSTYTFQRAISRQLISYKASNDAKEQIDPQPDLAASLPTVSADGLTYTFKLRKNVMWSTKKARAITSKDVANGFKRVCNPLLPASTASYFSVIEGMEEFCAAYDTKNPTAQNIKEHILNDSVSGISTPDDSTIVFKLKEKASDFIYMVSLSNVSPVAEESLDYTPDSPEYRENYISSGPYTVDEYKADGHLYLKRNPNWKRSSDPLRAANADRIEITFGVSTDSAVQQVSNGDADGLWAMSVPAAQWTTLQATNGDDMTTFAQGGTHYLAFNMLTSNNDGALKKTEVRQALQYAVDKAALVQKLGGKSLAEAAIGIFGRGVVGFDENDDPYKTDGNKGDSAKAKSLLAKAGAPNLTLKLAYRSDAGSEAAIAQIIQQDMEKAGVTIELVPVPSSDFYASFMTTPDNTKNGKWDLALCGWNPDWVGGAARSVFQPQFTYDGTAQVYNYSNYNNDKANELAKQALTSTDSTKAAQLWSKVNDAVMADPPVLPLYSVDATLIHSSAIKNASIFALSATYDWTNVSVER